MFAEYYNKLRGSHSSVLKRNASWILPVSRNSENYRISFLQFMNCDLLLLYLFNNWFKNKLTEDLQNWLKIKSLDLNTKSVQFVFC